MKNPALFVGQKTAMEKLFGDKISLLPKSLLDLIDIATVTDCDCEIIARKIECDSNKSLIVISALESTKTISWSLMPGIASHLLINDGRFVKNTSSRF
jgi:hypothetical protein